MFRNGIPGLTGLKYTQAGINYLAARLGSVNAGLLLYNSDTSKYEYWNGTAMVELGSDGGSAVYPSNCLFVSPVFVGMTDGVHFSSITSAIAASTADSYIRVFPGTYNEVGLAPICPMYFESGAIIQTPVSSDPNAAPVFYQTNRVPLNIFGKLRIKNNYSVAPAVWIDAAVSNVFEFDAIEADSCSPWFMLTSSTNDTERRTVITGNRLEGMFVDYSFGSDKNQTVVNLNRVLRIYVDGNSWAVYNVGDIYGVDTDGVQIVTAQNGCRAVINANRIRRGTISVSVGSLTIRHAEMYGVTMQVESSDDSDAYLLLDSVAQYYDDYSTVGKFKLTGTASHRAYARILNSRIIGLVGNDSNYCVAKFMASTICDSTTGCALPLGDGVLDV